MQNVTVNVNVNAIVNVNLNEDANVKVNVNSTPLNPQLILFLFLLSTPTPFHPFDSCQKNYTFLTRKTMPDNHYGCLPEFGSLARPLEIIHLLPWSFWNLEGGEELLDDNFRDNGKSGCCVLIKRVDNAFTNSQQFCLTWTTFWITEFYIRTKTIR